jgi:anti-sigma B factor antagonist
LPDELDFSVDVETDGAVRVIRLAGELDLATAPQLRAAFPDPIQETTVIVDMADLSFMGSSGVGELVIARKRSIDEGWTLRVRGVSGIVANVLRITGVDKVLAIEPEGGRGAPRPVAMKPQGSPARCFPAGGGAP